MSDATESDPTEPARRAALAEMHACGPRSRQDLERDFGRMWGTRELQEEFEVIGFLAPMVAVRRRSDGRKGSLKFQHDPRLYYDFVEA
jgi:hypothetical protein